MFFPPQHCKLDNMCNNCAYFLCVSRGSKSGHKTPHEGKKNPLAHAIVVRVGKMQGRSVKSPIRIVLVGWRARYLTA